jgi:hypothetical protein
VNESVFPVSVYVAVPVAALAFGVGRSFAPFIVERYVTLPPVMGSSSSSQAATARRTEPPAITASNVCFIDRVRMAHP